MCQWRFLLLLGLNAKICKHLDLFLFSPFTPVNTYASGASLIFLVPKAVLDGSIALLCLPITGRGIAEFFGQSSLPQRVFGYQSEPCLTWSRQAAGHRLCCHHAFLLAPEVQSLNGLSNVCSIQVVGFLPFSLVSPFFH